jgi:hypothetical protein
VAFVLTNGLCIMVYMDMVSCQARRKAYRNRRVSVKGKELSQACEALAMLIPCDMSVCTLLNGKLSR